jgi:glycerophosphoryl diester phosphodiesterase
MSRPLIIAHRGGAAMAPENTLPAFRQALDLGVDGIELDLHLNSAGELVVIHDVLAVHDLAPDAPRLEDVLDLVWAARPQSTIVIDLKAAPWNADQQDNGRRLVDAVAPVVEAYPRPDLLTLASFDWGALEHASSRLPAARTAFHTMAVRWIEALSPAQTGVADRRDLLAYLEDWRQRRGPGVEGLSPLDLIRTASASIWSCQQRDLTELAVRKARELDLGVWTWTVNTAADLVRVLGLGVDAVTTDRPDHVLRFLDTQQWEISE